jgi:subtilase family serine protease
VGPARTAASVRLVLPLRADLSGLERLALAVSTPRGPRYERYESIAALATRFGATAITRARVSRYLRAVGATHVAIDPTGLFADATVTAGLAERLFSAPLALFRTARGARFMAPLAAVHIPARLRGLVTAVVGLDTRSLATSSAPARLAQPRATARIASQPTSAEPLSGTPAGCAQGIAAGGFTPNQYLTAYDYGALQSAGIRGQGERVALIEIDGYRYGDITAFANCFGLDVPALRAFGVGLGHPLPPGGESTLDLEVLDAAAPDLKEIDVYESEPDAVHTLEALTAPLRNSRFKPQVISASLGLCEPDVRAAIGGPGIRASEAALQMAAASGITVLASSGDQGSADCTSFDGTPIDAPAVNYPSSSPWVTGVGGTNLLLSATNQIASQLVWNDTVLQPGSAGGGGSSTLFSRPAFQSGTVHRGSRFVPDVAMLADIAPGYAVFCSAAGDCIGQGNSNPWQSVGGTSAATPLLAGGFALVDQELRIHGHRQLGFVNPLLYTLGRSPARSQVFSDVLRYGNDVGPFIAGGGAPLGCCTAGPGYDRASGWGSVDIARFVLAAVALQPPDVGLTLAPRQRPVGQRHVIVTVSCGDTCHLAAYADVQIEASRPFRIQSRRYPLARAGRMTIALPFSARQVKALRLALRRRERIVATVVGLVFGGRGGVTAQTGGRRLTIVG